MAAPMRRAAPVTRTTWPESGMAASVVMAGGDDITEHGRHDAGRPGTDDAGRDRPWRKSRPAPARIDRRGRRLDPVFAVHARGALCAGPRLLHDESRSLRLGRGLHDLARAVAALRALPRRPDRGDLR